MGWVTNGTGEGSWIKIEFHQLIRISKIIYRHNEACPDKCCNQNFKDLSVQFSDGTLAGITVDDVFDSDANVDFHYRIHPPKVSSHLLLKVNAVYNHYKPATETDPREQYTEKRFGISDIRVVGELHAGSVT